MRESVATISSPLDKSLIELHCRRAIEIRVRIRFQLLFRIPAPTEHFHFQSFDLHRVE